MIDRLKIFVDLAKLFEMNGFHLFLVGGTVRDYLIGKPLNDMDAATDATVDDIVKFLPDINQTFKKFGYSKIKFEDINFDVTTFRKESNYVDKRHPNDVVFTKDIEEDVKRRDFTINALYMDSSLKVVDMVDGVAAIKNKIIKFIGDPSIRINEDPLRIIRGLRFMVDLAFVIEQETFNAMKLNADLLSNLNPLKVKEEISKCKNKQDLIKLLKDFNYCDKVISL